MSRRDTLLSLDTIKMVNWADDLSTDFDTEVDPHIELIINKIEQLSALDDGWMGYGSVAPFPKAMTGAAFFVTKMLLPDMPQPDVFPCPNGNIQLEWSCFDLDLEIEIESKTQYTVSFEDLAGNECWDQEFTYDLSELKRVLLLLTSRKSASKTGSSVVHG